MRLEIGNFYVKDIKFGDKLSFDDGVLTINKEEALDFIREDENHGGRSLYCKTWRQNSYVSGKGSNRT